MDNPNQTSQSALAALFGAPNVSRFEFLRKMTESPRFHQMQARQRLMEKFTTAVLADDNAKAERLFGMLDRLATDPTEPDDVQESRWEGIVVLCPYHIPEAMLGIAGDANEGKLLNVVESFATADDILGHYLRDTLGELIADYEIPQHDWRHVQHLANLNTTGQPESVAPLVNDWEKAADFVRRVADLKKAIADTGINIPSA